jgi:hypothetical protein
MKTTAILFSFYMLAMASFSSIAVVKVMLKSNCSTECCKKTCSTEMPNGCTKDKCLVLFSFNIQSFIVEKITEINFNFTTLKRKASINFYTENYIFQHLKNIFHPPEIGFLVKR